jgi:hypothetical protein
LKAAIIFFARRSFFELLNNVFYEPFHDPRMEPCITGERSGDVYARRRALLQARCAEYGDRFRIPVRKYNGRLRYETVHGFMYCENYKIGSTDWAIRVLNMNGVNITTGKTAGPAVKRERKGRGRRVRQSGRFVD